MILAMAVPKEEILHEIQRCAANNGGIPLGRERFMAETGLKESDWRGRYWVTWNDAIVEAGLAPNSMKGRIFDDEGILRRLALLTRKLGRFPTDAHLRLERRTDDSFPNATTVRERLGDKSTQVAGVRAFVEASDEFADVHQILSAGASNQTLKQSAEVVPTQVAGVVYLIKSGRYHKIGRSNSVGRRSYEIALQLPEKAVLVHSFETDDPAGIERYWHDRFKDRRRNGEWFLLSKADVAAFKRRRRFM